MSEQDKIKQAVEETIAEMNNKIDELKLIQTEEKTLEHNKNIDEVIEDLKEGITKIIKFYDEVKDSPMVVENIAIIKERTNVILTDVQNKIDNSKTYQKINEKIEETSAKEKVIAVVDTINNVTDTFLYAARDIYDEVSASDEMKKAVTTIKDTGIELGAKLKDVINNSFNNKG